MVLSLSKSKYCSAVQCPKMLWLKKYRAEQFDDSVMNQSILETGNEVGDLAMGLFGAYTEVPFGDLGEMINETKRLIDNRVHIIAEASFSYNNLFCSVDILINNGDDGVEIYEVKSSTSVKDIYIDDVTYQTYVLSKLGYKVKRISIVHVNNKYVRHGGLNLQELFSIKDVTEQVLHLTDNVETYIQYLDTYMQQNEEPYDDIGQHCFKPYECGFFKYCTRKLPKPNIFDVQGAYASTKFKCYDKGIVSFEDLNNCSLLSANLYKQIEHELFDCPPYVDKNAINDFLDKLSYPIYFLDFESFQPAIPLYDNSKPFEQIVFQYSLHYIEKEGGELKHKEFLAIPGSDPRRALAEQLCSDIPRNVCVTAYNRSFEKSRINNLAEIYPDLSEHLMNIHDNIEDLMIPFQKKQYYVKEMKGSYSIKYVLPALFPNEETLNYQNLEGVHNGAEASAAFKKMQSMEEKELYVYRRQLLDYCCLDTLAMVKIWEKLKEVVR